MQLYDGKTEFTLLGIILKKPDVLKGVRVSLKASDFGLEQNATIYRAFLDLADNGNPIELIPLSKQLEASGTMQKAGGESYLKELALTANEVITANPGFYAATIKDYAAKRDILKVWRKTRDDFRTGLSATEMFSQLKGRLLRMETGDLLGPDPYESLTKTLQDKFQKDCARDPNKPLGYSLSLFKGFSKSIDGVQRGFYVVGAVTSAGKTSFLCNLTLDLLDSNPDLRGIYFSLDDSKDIILNRLLSIKTGIHLNRIQFPGEHQTRKPSMHWKIQEGYNYLTEFATADRLFIRDSSEVQDIRAIEIEIRRRMDEGGLFVVIDALYNLAVETPSDDTRRLNMERANVLKALVGLFDIPVICSAELRKRSGKEQDKPPVIDDIMETGKFAYNADLVLLLYPEDWERYDTEDEPILKVKYAKNKLSHYRGLREITFQRATSRMQEV